MRIHSFLAGLANVHLVPVSNGVVLVDTGFNAPGMTRWVLRNMAREGFQPRQLRLILLSHGHVDHAGNVAALKRLTGAPVAMHRGDREMVLNGWHPCPPGRTRLGRFSSWVLNRMPWAYGFEGVTPDIWLEEGQVLAEFGLEGYVIETPGHSSGSISLVLEEGHIIVGDAILYRGGVHFPIYWEDEVRARESAHRIASFKPQWLHTGHGVSFRGDELEEFLGRE